MILAVLRAALIAANADWGRAVDELEGKLLSCAGQVLDCRQPTGAAQTLLRVAAQHPEALRDLHG